MVERRFVVPLMRVQFPLVALSNKTKTKKVTRKPKKGLSELKMKNLVCLDFCFMVKLS